MKEQCSFCEANVRFEAGSTPACGRHLAEAVRQEAIFRGGSCTVFVRENKE